jgi:hypothetical protein
LNLGSVQHHLSKTKADEYQVSYLSLIIKRAESEAMEHKIPWLRKAVPLWRYFVRGIFPFHPWYLHPPPNKKTPAKQQGFPLNERSISWCFPGKPGW